MEENCLKSFRLEFFFCHPGSWTVMAPNPFLITSTIASVGEQLVTPMSCWLCSLLTMSAVKDQRRITWPKHEHMVSRWLYHVQLGQWVCALFSIIDDEGPGRGIHLKRDKSLHFESYNSDTTCSHRIPIEQESILISSVPLLAWPPSEILLFSKEFWSSGYCELSSINAGCPDGDSPLKSGLALPKLSFSHLPLPFLCSRATSASHHSMVDHVPESRWWSSIWLGLGEGLPPVYDVCFSCCFRSFSCGFSSIIWLVKEASGIDLGPGSFEWLAYGSEKSRLDKFWRNRCSSTQARSLQAIGQVSYTTLISDKHSRAQVKSSAICHVGDWINAVHSKAVGLYLKEMEFRLSLEYWLRL